GHMRFTTRSNVEIGLADQKKVAPLIAKLEADGFPVGGTGNSVSMISHTQGWLHCDIPGTDASGVVKALMDELYEEFKKEEMPNRVKITTSCCQINCGGQGDISINVQHTKPPKINHDLVANVCERPAVIARCPVAAIRPALVNGKPSLEVDERKCICCGACYPPCPPMQINDPEHSKLAIWVGGKHSGTRSRPAFHKLVVAGLPNNPPRWPEVAEVVKTILYAYKENARPWERMNEWIDRIGWPRFFELTNLPFTKFHIDDWRGARASLNASSHVHF
ncbi:MAG: sulfite reductase, dissimilatory-type beta subunit, partial [Rhodospirillales bacterium RIFCSPLOWO2_12_FULL_67_15]